MPVIRLALSRLEALTGLDKDEITNILFDLKCEAEEVEPGILEVEVNADRPDMLIGEGIARAIKGITGRETGYKPSPTYTTDLTVKVGSTGSRRYIGAAVVENVNVDEEFLAELIQFQEKLHVTFGRRRRKAAIGFHDLSKIPCRSMEYKYMDPSQVSFKPLHGEHEMTGLEVIRSTEQGSLYGSINLEDGRHPFLLSCGEVIAMPPVINSDRTRVEPGTRDLFIDVTGPDRRTVEKVLDVIVSNLAERPGAKIGLVKIHYDWGEEVYTPPLKELELELDPLYTSNLLGFSIPPEEQASLLERMRHRAGLKEGTIKVTTPPYRVDILRPVDLVEDIAMAYGYHNIPLRTGWPIVRGRLTRRSIIARRLSYIMVGMGFTETLQLVLTGPSSTPSPLSVKDIVEVENPVMAEYSIMRNSLLPGLLKVAKANISASKPVKAFEIGPTVERRGGEVIESWKIGIMYMDDEASYEDIQAVVYKLLRIAGLEPRAEPFNHPLLIPGRTAAVYHGEDYLGVIGETRPEVLVELGIEYPVLLAEMDLDRITRVMSNE